MSSSVALPSLSPQWDVYDWNDAMLHCPFMLFVRINPSGVIEKANIEFARVKGVVPSKLMGTHVRDVLGIQSLEGTLIDECFRTGKLIRGQSLSKGPYTGFEFMAAPLKQRDKVLAVKLFGIPTDRVIHPKSPMEIAPSVDHIKRFASIAAHEIDNSLTTILTTTQLLRKTHEDAPQVDRLTKRIEDAALQAVALMHDLKLLGSPIRLHESVDINQLIVGLAETMASDAQAANVTIILRTRKNLPPVKSDNTRIRQVFVNLIKNALEAVDPSKPSTLVIKTSRVRNDTINVSFFNRGAPVPRKLKERLFEPFFSTKSSGVGLGLPTSFDIVHAHGGTLTFRSSALLGTLFRVRLPAHIKN